MDRANDHLDFVNLKAIFFDLGQVLFTFDWQIAVPRFAALNGGDRALVEQFLAHQFHIDYEAGGYTDAEFFQKASELMCFRGTYEQFCDIWCDIFAEIETTTTLARQLATLYPLYVISNTNPLHIEFLTTRHDLFQIFLDTFYSYTFQARKPDPQLYYAILERAGFDAPSALLVDDKLDNVVSARAVGMQTLHVPTPTIAQVKLQELIEQARPQRAEP